MTPKDKGMLRELLHEYRPAPLIQVLAKAAYGPGAGAFLRSLAQGLDAEYDRGVTAIPLTYQNPYPFWQRL